MAQRNGTWKVIATVGGFILVALGAAVAYGVLCKTVSDIEPEVKLNSTHRIQAEIDTKYIKQEISDIKVIQREILEEVRK